MTRRRDHRHRPGLPDTVRTPRERQELLVSHLIIAALQLGIAGALAVAAFQTYHMWRQGVPYIPGQIARMIPLSLMLGAAGALMAASRSIARVRTILRLPLETTPEP
jgi:hypothetical protein